MKTGLTIVFGVVAIGFVGVAFYFSTKRSGSKKQTVLPTMTNLPARQYARPSISRGVIQPVTLFNQAIAAVTEQSSGTTTNYETGAPITTAGSGFDTTYDPSGQTTTFDTAGDTNTGTTTLFDTGS